MATLRSFDLRDAAETSTDMTGFQATRNRLNGASLNNNLSEEEGSEFEDSFIETPNSLRTARSHNTSHAVSEREMRSPSVYIARNTTIKVPLKGASSPQTKRPSTPGNRTSRRVSTPGTVSGKISKHRSRNGTPLKQPPINSQRLEDEEDGAIRRLRVLSDDNRFSPYHIQNSLPLGSPVRRNRSHEVAHSPPSNLKIRPLPEFSKVLAVTSTPAQGNVTSIDDEEFESSENEEPEIGAKSFSKINSEPLPISRSFGGEYLIKPPPEPRPNLAGNLGHDSNSSFLRKEKSRRQQPSSTPLPPAVTTAISPTPQPAEMREVSGLRAAVLQEALDRSSPTRSHTVLVLERMGSEVLSKSEIMEKINSSFNLIREKDLSQTNEKDLIEDDESDDSQILEEIGSFLPQSDLRIPVRVLETSPRKVVTVRNDLPPRKLNDMASLHENTVPGPQNSLAQKYERELLERKKREFASRKSNISPSPAQYDEWPMSKWALLRKLLSSQGLNKTNIVNSDLLVNKLQCSGKQELRQRVDYLLAYEKATSRKKAARKRSKAAR